MSITVAAVNDPPVASSQSGSTAEDTSLAITLTASDVEDDPLTYSVVTGPANGVLSGTPPSLTYTPAPDWNGSDSFTFRASDGQADSNVAVVSITVTPVNDAPVSSPQSVATPEDTPVAITLTATDADGDALVYTVVTGPANGVLSGTPPSLTYTPGPEWSGSDGFTFKASDGLVESNVAAVSITVAAVNDPPVASPQSVATAEDVPVAITLAASDVDGGALTYTVVTSPASGSLSGAGPDLTYTPSANFNGSDSFTFSASDGQAVSNVATVSIAVAAVNDAPVANPQSVTTDQDAPVAITLSAADVDGDPLTYAVVAPPSSGALSGAAPDLIYTPGPGYSGPDSFTFRANDSQADSGVALVSITVVPAPVIEFRTQVVKITIPSRAQSATATAPGAFAAVDPSRTIALISGVTQHAMGWTAQTTQTPVQISARVMLADGSTLTARRSSGSVAQTDTVWVLLLEYIGAPGGPNELIVRDRRVHAWSSGATSASYGPIGSVASTSKVVVFNASAENPNTKSGDYDRGDVRAYIDGQKTVQLRRGDGAGAIQSSHQVVELTGANWQVQTGDAVPSPHVPAGGPEAGGTDVAIASVGDVSRAWVYFTWQTNTANLDERGHRVWLTSPTNLRVQEHAEATGSKTIRWHVIQNPQIRVQTGAADGQFGTSVTATVGGFAPVTDPGSSFAWVQGMTAGGANNHPRDMWQFELQNGSTISLQRGYSGADLFYRHVVVELSPSN
ncbi:MAG: tandem-95 repeat protein [Planctomycetes bacterium]|nr:tandem-95 repeat protein [Planctomycetota bacterium]